MEWNIDMLISEDELCHHGIKGQKWGIRRFQKKDGSLTPAGKGRYNDDTTKKGKKSKPVRVGKAFVSAFVRDTATGFATAVLINNGYEGAGKIVAKAGGAASWGMLAKDLYDIVTDKD